jgi:glutamine cyclotransferase
MKAVLILFTIIFINNITAVHINSANIMESNAITNNSFTNIKSFKRPETYYTQGIFFENGSTLYESGGLYGESVLVKMEYPSLKILNKVKLDSKFFAEGVAQCSDVIYQLTWQEKTVLKYSKDDLKLLDKLPLPVEMAEGWGLSAYKDGQLIATDGSNRIYVIDCTDFKVKRTLNVTNNGQEIRSLNALAFDGKDIYANIYFNTNIAKIDDETGNVTIMYEMKDLVSHEMSERTLDVFALSSGDVLNGIAYDKNTDSFLLTGKRWGFYYNIKFNN